MTRTGVSLVTDQDAMLPLPSDGTIAPGTLVWGSAFNAASALLYRWWGLLDAPPGTETARFWEKLFEDGVRVNTPDVTADSLASLRDAVARMDRQIERAHHLGYDEIRLVWRETGLSEVRATFTTQRRSGDTVSTDRRSCVAVVQHDPDGRFAFRSIDERIEHAEPDSPFVASYVVNRARATSTRFQAYMDALTGESNDMRDLLMPVLELHGLVAAKKDGSIADADYSDVNELRQSIAGSDTVADNAIRDFEGFSAWFATTPALFTYGLHKLERFEVTPLPDRRYEAIAQYDWRAETINGAKIETHHPLTWVLADTDEAYMRIEKLLPFG